MYPAQMMVNNLSAVLHLPAAPSGEGLHSLPPPCPQTAYKVDEYSACPTNWMHGSAKAGSYFVGVQPGKHLWLDFSANRANPHHVAVVLSVQGINPITGQKTKTLNLEQYRENCPEHGIPFKQDRLCEACGKKWPPQNYMTTYSHQGGFWVDGWNMDGDKVRGFLITEETMRGVASQMIGEDRVWAIGVAFFLSKEPKPAPIPTYRHTSLAMSADSTAVPTVLRSAGLGKMRIKRMIPDPGVQESSLVPMSGDDPYRSHAVDLEDGGSRGLDVPEAPVEVKKLEIGAGAQIRQVLTYYDSNPLSFYRDEPEALIYINYCLPADLEKILAAGKSPAAANQEGFMKGLNVGNP
jgi:hypothetical protein